MKNMAEIRKNMDESGKIWIKSGKKLMKPRKIWMKSGKYE